MSRAASLVAAVVLSVLLVTPASAQQIFDALRVAQPGLQYNARALGLGNAYSTVGYDFSAVRFNPATMSLNNRFSWSTTVNADVYKTRSDYYGNQVTYSTTNMKGGQIGVTIPFRLDSTHTMVLGLGYTQSKDFGLGYKYQGLNLGGTFPSFIQGLAGRTDPTARLLGLTYPVPDGSGNSFTDQTILGAGMYETGFLLDEGHLTHFSFGASIEAVHNIFFGVSGTYNTGRYTSDLQMTATDVNDVYPAGVTTVPGNTESDGFISADYRTVRDNEYSGWDARFGMLYQFFDVIGLSASFKLPDQHKVSEDVFVSGTSRFAGNRSIVVPQTESRTNWFFKPPAELTVGAKVNLGIIMGTAEATYVDYTSMQVLSGVGTLPDRTAINKQIKEDLATVINLNAGAEVRLPFTGLSARAGGIYQPSPFRSDPSRFARKAVTVGAGFDSNDTVQFDIGYAYAWRGENSIQQVVDAIGSGQNTGYHTVLFTMRVAY
jgi:long-subunit fatty acid transport protein